MGGKRFGQVIRAQRERLGLTQRELGDRVGCTDGYIAHLEREVKIPSLNICMALTDVFDFSATQQDSFLQTVEAARVERSRDRIRTRGAAVRGALEAKRGTKGQSAAKEERSDDAVGPDQIANDLRRYPKLRAAYADLKTAFDDPRMRDTVLNALQALARSARRT